MREERKALWNRQAERVDSVNSLLYDQLVVHESSNAAPDIDEAAKLLAEKAIEAGVERFVESELLEDFLGRLDFAEIAAPEIPDLLREFCRGHRSFAELRGAHGGFLSWLEGLWIEASGNAHRLREAAPRTLRLTAGRQVRVHYERGKAPWMASRLQDFFGMNDAPRIGPKHTPAVLHLLAPNKRAVQTTTDLRGFWERLYPEVRRELMRRYPRHSWPERHGN
jgi:ATP-dependent helicase HrpB